MVVVVMRTTSCQQTTEAQAHLGLHVPQVVHVRLQDVCVEARQRPDRASAGLHGNLLAGMLVLRHCLASAEFEKHWRVAQQVSCRIALSLCWSAETGAVVAH